jgi:hypothetical protein
MLGGSARRKFMADSPWPVDGEQWVIWNGASAILAMATIGRVSTSPAGRIAWMGAPFDMVGPFSLEALQSEGRIAFAACVVMSRQRWQEDQVELRQQAYEQRRAAQERLNRAHAGFNGGSRWGHGHREDLDERVHRQTLKLPADGKLEASQIKKAYRRLAQKAHPDLGGSHAEFLRITEARNALLEWVS